MYRTNHDSNSRIGDENAIYDYVTDTFKAFADTMIPQSPGLAEVYGRIQYYGALNLYTDEYLIMSLDSLSIPLAIPTAEILNVTAKQFLYGKEDERNFSSLSPLERLQAIELLLQPEGITYFPALPQMSQQDIFPVIQSLNRLAMMGYYSEWSGYGSTRLKPPNQRTLEHYPVSWEQIGYPGPSLGYRAARSFSYT